VSTPKSWAQKRLNRGNFWGNPWSEKPLARELGWDEVAESGMNPSVHIHITAELADLPIMIMIPLLCGRPLSLRQSLRNFGGANSGFGKLIYEPTK